MEGSLDARQRSWRIETGATASLVDGSPTVRQWVYPQARMNQDKLVVHSDPEIMSGTPVFVGTRVPVQTLLEYLEAGQPLSEFLEDFPTVSKEQAVAALEQAKAALLASARPA